MIWCCIYPILSWILDNSFPQVRVPGGCSLVWTAWNSCGCICRSDANCPILHWRLKKYILHNRYYLKRYKSNLNTPKNIRVVNRMFYTWTRLHVAVFINGSRSITIITPISWQDFFGPSISPNTTATCLRAIPQYPSIPLTINWMVVKKKQQKWYYTGKNKR